MKNVKLNNELTEKLNEVLRDFIHDNSQAFNSQLEVSEFCLQATESLVFPLLFSDDEEEPEFEIVMDSEISGCGTSLQGYFPENVTYQDLVKVFGKPNCLGDGFKVDAEWIGRINDRTFTIYNYKTGKNYCGDAGKSVEDLKGADWHIGGNSKWVATDVIKALKIKLKK